MIDVSIDDIREYLVINSKSKTGLSWKKSRGTAKTGSDAGSYGSRGYWVVLFGRKHIMAHRIVWALAHGEWPCEFIDHINGIKTDNRACNLRDVSRSVNQKNQKLSSRNSSGFCGVSFDKSRGKWTAQIQANGVRKRIGRYETFESACNAMNMARDADGGFTDRHGKSELFE